MNFRKRKLQKTDEKKEICTYSLNKLTIQLVPRLINEPVHSLQELHTFLTWFKRPFYQSSSCSAILPSLIKKKIIIKAQIPIKNVVHEFKTHINAN